MSIEDDTYRKASGFELNSQRHNHRVFLRQLRRHPWLAVLLAVLFAGLGLALLLQSAASAASVSARSWLLMVICLALAVYLLAVVACKPKAGGKQ